MFKMRPLILINTYKFATQPAGEVVENESLPTHCWFDDTGVWASAGQLDSVYQKEKCILTQQSQS